MRDSLRRWPASMYLLDLSRFRVRAIRVLRCVAMLGLLTAGVDADDGRILIVGSPPDHPEGTHRYAEAGESLARHWREQFQANVETTLSWPPKHERLQDLDAIVFYSSPVGERVLHPDHRHRFLELMDRGTGLVCIHWSTGVGYSELAESTAVRDEFLRTLGGWFRRPPCGIHVGKSMLKQVSPMHPMCRGWSDYEIHDEFYLHPVLHSNAVPILEVSVEGERHTVAWSMERKSPRRNDGRNGRSIGITLGHFDENFRDPRFVNILTRATQWVMHKD